MKDKRSGETLWQEWSGEGYSKVDSSSIVFYTHGPVDVENEIVKRALASALQREGIVYSLGDAFKKLENADKTTIKHGYVGTVDGSWEEHACDEYGETRFGDVVDEICTAVWIDFS